MGYHLAASPLLTSGSCQIRSLFFPTWFALLISSVSVIGVRSTLADVSPLHPDTLALINKFMTTLSPPMVRRQLVEADIPAIGCPQDGQVGPRDAPTLPKTMRVIVPEGTASALAYYSAHEGAATGVLAPKGWDCFGTYGSGGSTLYVVPRRLGEPILDRPDKVKDGPAVINRFSIGETSGRFVVAQISARICPLARSFVERVRDEGLDDPKNYVFAPWATDRLTRLSDFAVSYVTPSGAVGLGTAFGPREQIVEPPRKGPISGLVFLTGIGNGDGPFLEQLAVRLEGADQRLYTAIAVSRIAAVDLPHSNDNGTADDIDKELNAGELTEKIRDECTQLWNAPEPIAACLLEREHEYGNVLSDKYRKLLKLSPNNAAALRESQRSWLRFQDLNCKLHEVRATEEEPATARVSRATCLLLTTIQRAKELKQMSDHR